MIRVDRRTFLLASTAVGVAAACGGGSGSTESTEDGSAEEPAEPLEERSRRVEWLVPTFPDGFRAASMIAAGIPQRISFVVRDNVDILRADAPDVIDIAITHDAAAVVSGAYAAQRDGIITPYYPVEFTPAEPGTYTATVVGTTPVDFIVEERSAVPIVQVGDPMRPVATPTVEDALGVDPICTRAVPCPFHVMSLDDALASGRPTVLLVATPGFCQTDICGPVVELLIDAVTDRNDLAVVHAEVYVDPSEFASGTFPATTPVVETYSLTYEPHLVVGDRTGTVVARLDTIWDGVELADALARVL